MESQGKGAPPRPSNPDPRGVLLRNLGGGVPPGSQNPDPFSDQKSVIFHIRFQTWSLRNYVIVTQIRRYIRTPNKTHFEFVYYSFFPVHLELERQIPSYTPLVPSKTIPDSRPIRAKCVPVFRPKRRKNPSYLLGHCIPILLI